MPGVAHDSAEVKGTFKWRLDVRRLEAALKRGGAALREWRPPQDNTLDEDRRRKRRRRDFYDMDTSHWKLRGAARPAAQVLAASLGLPDPDAPPEVPSENYFEMFAGRLYDGPQPCKDYLKTLLVLARALHDGGGRSVKAVPHYKRCLELDVEDRIGAKMHLARCLLSAGEAAEARALVESMPDDASASVRWTAVALEFLSWSILGEADSSEAAAVSALDAAVAANPYVAWWLAYPDTFNEVVEYHEKIEEPAVGSVSEAFWYCRLEAPLWAELEGASKWLAAAVLRQELPKKPKDNKNKEEEAKEPNENKEEEEEMMFWGMFETAVAMVQEEMKLERESAGGSEEGDGE